MSPPPPASKIPGPNTQKRSREETAQEDKTVKQPKVEDVQTDKPDGVSEPPIPPSTFEVPEPGKKSTDDVPDSQPDPEPKTIIPQAAQGRGKRLTAKAAAAAAGKAFTAYGSTDTNPFATPGLTDQLTESKKAIERMKLKHLENAAAYKARIDIAMKGGEN